MIIKNGQTSNLIRLSLKNSTTGLPLTGLTFSSTGLIIGTIADNEQISLAYTAAASSIETITTLGTYAAPTTIAGPPPTKCRFKEVDSGNHPGLYELQIADARFAVANARSLIITLSGATNLLATDFLIQLSGAGFDPLFSAAPGASGGVLISGSNTGTVTISNGLVINRSTADTSAFICTGNGVGNGVDFVGGSGLASAGLNLSSGATNRTGLLLTGFGSGAAISAIGQVNISDGVAITATTTTNRAGLAITGNGTGHGVVTTGGSTSGDGFRCVGLGTGVDIRGNITGNITGALSGSVQSIAAGGIVAASFATDAITATALKLDAVAEIVNGVWNELTASHVVAGTFGLAMTSGSGLSPQQVRDSMKLAPSAGTPAAGSIDTLIAAAEQSSSFASDFATAFTTATIGAGTLATALDAQGYTAVRATQLDNIGTGPAIDQAGVQAALTAQGYTPTRAPKLDYLDVPVSGLTGGLTDLNEEPVPAGRTCTLVRDSLIGDHAVTLKIGTDPTFCMDFVNDIATNDYISIVDTPIMVSGPTNGITFGQTGRDHSKAKVRIAGITAGTYDVSVRVTYNDGSTRTGTMTIEVVA